jgi:pimeloyl-ACP methyl ester carboxylesterase
VATAFEPARSVSVEGTSFAYREEGAGEPVVFVHGDISDLRTWEQQLPAVGASYRAIAYSRRYARPNEDIEPGADNQMLPHVDDVAAFLRAIDAVPAHLVGNSWGAFIALLTAVRHPDLVRSLVLEEPPVMPLFVSTPPRPKELLRTLIRRPRTAIALIGFGAKVMGPVQKAFRRDDDEKAMLTFVGGVLGGELYERLPDARKQQMRENLGALKAQLLGAGFPLLRDDEVRGVSASTLLVTGERSPAFLLRLTDRLEELLPHAERVEIPGASHLMHEQNTPALNAAILDFLARLGRRQAGTPPT